MKIAPFEFGVFLMLIFTFWEPQCHFVSEIVRMPPSLSPNLEGAGEVRIWALDEERGREGRTSSAALRGGRSLVSPVFTQVFLFHHATIQ